MDLVRRALVEVFDHQAVDVHRRIRDQQKPQRDDLVPLPAGLCLLEHLEQVVPEVTQLVQHRDHALVVGHLVHAPSMKVGDGPLTRILGLYPLGRNLPTFTKLEAVARRAWNKDSIRLGDAHRALAIDGDLFVLELFAQDEVLPVSSPARNNLGSL